LEYEKANPDAATYDVIDMMWQIRFMGAENTAVDRFSQDSGQQDLQIHYLSLLRNKLDDEYSRHEVRIKTLLKRKLVGTEQERVKQGAGIDRLGQKETLDILFKQVNGKVIAASFFSGVDLVPEFAEKLKKVLPQESKNLAGYYAYLYLDGIIVGMNDYVYNAAYLASPETDYSKKGVAGEKAENDFYAMVEAIKELAGNMRIVSASTSGGITSVNTALTKLLSRMPNGALSGKLNVAGELRDKSTNGIAILLNQLAGELADMMPDNFGSYALRNEFARFFVEEYKGIGFTRDLIDERGYDEDKILLTAPAPSTVSTSTNTENNSVGYSDDDEEESPAPDTGRVQADDVSGGITGNQKE
jgi:hypothetical protein